jgi:hypothetical protein
MPVVAMTMAELLRTVLENDGRPAVLPDRYGYAYEPRLPWQLKPIFEPIGTLAVS